MIILVTILMVLKRVYLHNIRYCALQKQDTMLPDLFCSLLFYHSIVVDSSLKRWYSPSYSINQPICTQSEHSHVMKSPPTGPCNKPDVSNPQQIPFLSPIYLGQVGSFFHVFPPNVCMYSFFLMCALFPTCPILFNLIILIIYG